MLVESNSVEVVPMSKGLVHKVVSLLDISITSLEIFFREATTFLSKREEFGLYDDQVVLSLPSVNFIRLPKPTGPKRRIWSFLRTYKTARRSKDANSSHLMSRLQRIVLYLKLF